MIEIISNLLAKAYSLIFSITSSITFSDLTIPFLLRLFPSHSNCGLINATIKLSSFKNLYKFSKIYLKEINETSIEIKSTFSPIISKSKYLKFVFSRLITLLSFNKLSTSWSLPTSIA